MNLASHALLNIINFPFFICFFYLPFVVFTVSILSQIARRSRGARQELVDGGRE